MNLKNIIFLLLILVSYQFLTADSDAREYPKSKASYSDFAHLVDEVEDYRSARLLDLNRFLALSRKKNTIILDTRSRYRYDRKHLQGAVNLPFSDFTQAELEKIIPNDNTTILIYCNNNFADDPIDFATKFYDPSTSMNQFGEQQKPIMLALNIPTFINLYGYGYRDIYELDEYVDVSDPRLSFEGTEVIQQD